MRQTTTWRRGACAERPRQKWKELLVLARAVSDKVPYGYRKFADQLLRAGGSVGGHIAEGANHRARGKKRDRFQDALAECGEADGWAESLANAGLVPQRDYQKLHRVAGRTAALIAGLLRRLDRG